MDNSTERYIADQLSLFAGGVDHVMVEFTGHLHAGEDDLVIGIRISHCPTGEPICIQVPMVIGRITRIDELAIELTDILAAIRSLIEPFP